MAGNSDRQVSTPAARIIRQLGGPKRVAALTGRHPHTVYRWVKPSPRGSGGRVPPAAQAVLVAKGVAQFSDFLPRDGEAFQ
jgi:hypothetical protein